MEAILGRGSLSSLWDESLLLAITGMMLIVQGAVNQNYLSLQERLTVQSGYYILVRFISEDSQQETSVIATVLSGTTAYRYHQLTITEINNASVSDRQSGSVTLDPYGMFLYEAYQVSGNTVLDYCDQTLLEVGKCLVTQAIGFDSPQEYTG